MAINKRALMKVYNALKQEKLVEQKRLNKALAIVMRGDPPKYYTTIDSCTCPDHVQRREFICKHRLALMLQQPEDTLIMLWMGELQV